MADYDDVAFDAMNKANPDRDITGGAIMYSQFEMDMSPREQENYKASLLGTLNKAYASDPHKGRLGFADWLDNLNPELMMQRADEYEEVRNDKEAMNKMTPDKYNVIESAGMLQSLLDKHTGRLKDIKDIIGSDVPRPAQEFNVMEEPAGKGY